MATNNYRLGEYKIIESGSGELRWEAHSGFAALAEGRCFRKGTILFIGQPENDQIGFLKGDFLDHIKPFPAWSKTRYYCSAVDMYRCDTGKRVAKQEMLMWMIGRGRGEGQRPCPEGPGRCSNHIATGKAVKNGTFRLERYEITRKTTGQILWKTAQGPNTVNKGTCIVLEDILFIGPRENTEFDFIGRQFAENLQQLPKWDQTEYCCPESSLCDCRSSKSVQERRTTWPRARRETGKHDDVGKVAKRIRFEPVRSEIWKRQAFIFSHRANKFFIYAAEVLHLIFSFSFACSIRFCKEIKRRWHLKKGEGPSVHHHGDQI